MTMVFVEVVIYLYTFGIIHLVRNQIFLEKLTSLNPWYAHECRHRPITLPNTDILDSQFLYKDHLYTISLVSLKLGTTGIKTHVLFVRNL